MYHVYMYNMMQGIHKTSTTAKKKFEDGARRELVLVVIVSGCSYQVLFSSTYKFNDG